MPSHHTTLRRLLSTLHHHRARSVAGGLGLLLLVGGCAPDDAAPTQSIDGSQLYWAVTVDHQAVTLSLDAPYDTLRLTATARTATGAALSDAPVPRFRSTDVDLVQVDSTGLLHAVKVTTGTVVIAEDTVDNIVHSDTVWVNVTDVPDPPMLANLSIHPVPPDSAAFALGGTLFQFQKVLTARAVDASGTPIDGIAVHYASSDPLVATIDPTTGAITTNRVGAVTFTASATAYGVTRADTLPFTIGLPVWAAMSITQRVTDQGDTVPVFPLAPTVIGAGGDVSWNNETSLSVDVTFDDSTNVTQDDQVCAAFGAFASDAFCGGGNIPAWSADTTGNYLLSIRVRHFRVPGTYHYRSTRYGVTGTIIVQ